MGKAVPAAKEHLERLASRFVSSNISTCSCVGVGNPAEQILAHARQSGADMIILPSYKDWSLAQLKLRPGAVGQVLNSAPCNVSLLHVRTHFNCEEQWALVEDIVAALDYVGLLKPTNRWVAVGS